jgi:hypothetical protein
LRLPVEKFHDAWVNVNARRMQNEPSRDVKERLTPYNLTRRNWLAQI